MNGTKNIHKILFVVTGLVIGAGGAALLMRDWSDDGAGMAGEHGAHEGMAMPGEADAGAHEGMAMPGEAEGATMPGQSDPPAEAAGEREILYWRAPMDPNYTSDRPGKSPMGMDLVPVYADEGMADGPPRHDDDRDRRGRAAADHVERGRGGRCDEAHRGAANGRGRDVAGGGAAGVSGGFPYVEGVGEGE